jgi:flagellar biogenesis protein FliO
MPQTRFFHKNPWIFPAALGLVLGVCLWGSWGPSRAFALDSNSPLFQQGIPQGKTAQPLALPEEAPTPSPGIFSTFLRLIFALAVTIGLIVLTVWGLKLVWEKKGWNSPGDENKPVKVLASTFLAPRKTIYLVEIGSRILVLGVGHEEVNCLDVIRESGEVEALKAASQQGFPKIFSRVIHRNEMAEERVEARKILEEGSKTLGGYVEKLRKLKSKEKHPDGSADDQA